jgi:L-threonylcarbamoyladenylate synthase
VSAERVVASVRAGEPVLLPTDTVYGLCADPFRPEPARRVARLKGRAESQPLALLADDVEALLECVPELHGRIPPGLLPGPYTLVLPNPARRYPWLTGSRPETIGVRVPALPEEARSVVEAIGAVLATSANRHGGPDPRLLDDVPAEIRRGVGAELDGGELPGTASTVLDLTGAEPRVLREGAVSAAEALARVAGAIS